MKETATTVPEPETFRAWLRKSLTALGMKPTALAKAAGIGRNGVTQFLAGHPRDLRLGTANALQRALVAAAAETGTPLPPLTVGGGDA